MNKVGAYTVIIMKRVTAQLILSLLLSITALGDGKLYPEVNLSKPYWLNYSLIFLEGCQPRISPDNITFTVGTCTVNAYKGKIFSRGAKIKIYSITEGNGHTKVRFRYWPQSYELESEYEVLLKNDSKKTLRKSFALLFSQREVPVEYKCPDQLKTKKHIIKCLGFPIEVHQERDVEKYFYILEFVGPNPFSGFDGFSVEIKKGKFKNVTGYI